jgi:hypothetical protein
MVVNKLDLGEYLKQSEKFTSLLWLLAHRVEYPDNSAPYLSNESWRQCGTSKR